MSFPKCPHCDYEFDAEDIWYAGSTDFPSENDGDESETHCLSCNHPLRIVLDLEPSWRFLDEDGEELNQ